MTKFILRGSYEMFIQYFRYDPLIIFRNSRTPAGLYARQKWIQEGDTKAWQSDFRETVETLFSGQRRNGSWEDAPLITIHRLFGLHLTVRNRNEQIDRALEWLLSLDIVRRGRVHFSRKSDVIYGHELRSLPFTRGCYDHVVTCAILFLASLFGHEFDEQVITVYDRLARTPRGSKGKWCSWSCSNNFLRACIVHPDFRESDGLKSLVSALLEVQRSDGNWPAPIPFYPTVNALGHLDKEDADLMLGRAFRKLHQNQNRDGTWGRTDKEWKTFLIVHALKRKSSLLEKMQAIP
jgi:hypothetical protein